MKIAVNDIKMGNVVKYDGALCLVVKLPEHVKPGKGPAYVQLEIRNIKAGNKSNVRLSSSETIEKAHLDTTDYQYLYSEGDDFILMDTETFEQITINKDIVGDNHVFLTESMMIKVVSYENNPLNVEFPQYIICEIVETDPHLKGSTVTSSYKPAILSNGVKVKVPPYVVQGDKIKIKTECRSFVERVKNNS